MVLNFKITSGISSPLRPGRYFPKGECASPAVEKRRTEESGQNAGWPENRVCWDHYPVAIADPTLKTGRQRTVLPKYYIRSAVWKKRWKEIFTLAVNVLQTGVKLAVWADTTNPVHSFKFCVVAGRSIVEGVGCDNGRRFLEISFSFGTKHQQSK